jgi:hypothetical protein
MRASRFFLHGSSARYAAQLRAAPLFALALLGCTHAALAADPPPAVLAAPAAAAPAVAPPKPSPDGIALASPRAAATREPSSPDAWGGARTGKEETLSDRVVAYDIAAQLDPVAHTVDATETLTWRNRSKQEVRAVYLHLYLNAFQGYQSTFFSESRNSGFQFRSDVPMHDGEWGHIALGAVSQGGAPVSWLYVHPDGGPDTDHTVVRLDLPTPVPAGKTTTLQIAFHDQLPRVVARTGYFGTFHLVGQWFPKIGVLELPGERGAHALQWNVHEFHLHSEFYADYGSFDVHLTVPKGYTVGATGEEQGEPVAAGDLVTHHFVQGDVHDFAWTADNRTAPILEGEYHGEGSPPVKVRVLFPPEYAQDAPGVLKATIDSLGFFSRTLGPYPYKTATAVVPPFNAGEAGGMEYPTFFTADSVAHPDAGTIGEFILDFVTIHEFGHGYFYGILGSNEFEEPMLDEGLNEYWDMRMLRERKQQVYLGTRFTKLLGITPTLSGFELDRLSALRDDPTDALGANSWDRFSSPGFGSVYSRTTTTMHDLEEAVGKETMERAFHGYYERWKFRHPGIADLKESLAEGTGQRALVEAVFAQQVYAASKLDDAVDKLTSEEELPLAGTVVVDGKTVETKRDDVSKQIDEAREAWKKAHPDAKEGTGPFPFRTTVTLRHRGVATAQEVVVTFADGSTEKFVWDSSEAWARFSWVKPVRAVSAQIDPQEHHTLDASILDNSLTVDADHSASSRWGAGVAAILQTLFTALGSL